ncbi:DUF115 domain-containing protein [Brevibacillus borstelensis]|uniref:motility associated factor glycosyltransferase family protein n=1 Tax=Brevibacillus borstelensis TaxID=45462 RepID=UPI00204254B8|nr:6-hydroxymethylpterin diphosphokinase MptE-like protein [Brevibacillus borstelensis]MCM3590170.1 DUF115 domain-containing protein [Brevibacillus borstelensis]
MILIDNVLFFKNKFPSTWKLVKEAEEKGISEAVQLEEARTGGMSITVQTEKGINYLHSKYNPVSEAEKVMDTYEDIGEYSHVFFYGIGMGYHVEWFIEKYPEMSFTLYEPNLDVFQLVGRNKIFEKWNSRYLENFYLGDDPEVISKNLGHFIQVVKEKVLLVVLPSYERIFTQQTRNFIAEFRNVVYKKGALIQAGTIFSKRLPVNSIINLPTMLRTPNILHEKPNSFQGKPAILVAAGPSLDFEYENLRYIKENGLAYIFSVGSAINALIDQDIYPDAACTYDGSARNQHVFSKVVERGIDEIPLIYGSLVGYEVIKQYPGQLLHFLISSDSFSSYTLKHSDKLDFVNPATTIAIITLQLLYKLGCSPVILVGQNLAFLEDQSYAQGMVIDTTLSEQQKQNAILVKDVEGNDVYTSRGLDSFRKEMEFAIRQLDGLEIINTTKRGANIRGTKYVPLELVIKDQLKEKNVVDQDWKTKYENKYDFKHVLEKVHNLLAEQDEFLRISSMFYSLFDEMNHYMGTLNEKSLEKCFTKFDKLFDRLNSNDFYRLLLLQMNALLFESILKMFEEIRFHKDQYYKAKKVISEFGHFLKQCESDRDPVKSMLEKSLEELKVVQ